MKILLAGGGGYIGTYLTEKLINLNHHITVIDLFWFNDNLPNNITKINKNFTYKNYIYKKAIYWLY